MNNKAPNIQALARKFRHLIITDLAFRQCKALAEHMVAEHLDANSLLFTPQMTGVVVTYAKNFVEAEGFGSLQAPFLSFTDEALQETHDKIMDARHKLYAHRDATAAKDFTYDDNSPVVPYQVGIELRNDECAGHGIRLQRE